MGRNRWNAPACWSGPECWNRVGTRLAIACLAVAWLGFGRPATAWEVPKESIWLGRDASVPTAPGETLYQVARRHGFALEHLADANDLPVSLEGVPVASLRLPTRRLLPTNPPAAGLVVNLPERGFYLFGAGSPRFFPIAIGEPGRFATPTGDFSILEKVIDPEWIAPEWAGLGENNVIPAGPDNPLGDRWIGLSSSGLGMHSTNNPSSIGSATSHGCMRMYPEVARQVFDLVKVGWPVRIEYQTVRLGLDETGLYLTAFPDVYHRGGRENELRQRFAEQDLQGFLQSSTCRPVLEAARGLPVRVADLRPRIALGEKLFPGARLGSTLYLEQSTLAALGVEVDFALAERQVRLRRDSRSVTVPLYLNEPSDRSPHQAFLSRGTGWYPARAALEPLGLVLTWEAKDQRLRVAP